MIVLKNANIINFLPATVSFNIDVIIENDSILNMGKNIAGNYNAQKVIDLSNKFISPGLVCSHNHFYSALARGITANIKPSNDFIGILKNLWWKLDRALDEETLYYSGLAGALESIKSGTTSVIDHNASPSFIKGSLKTLEKGFEKTGLRGILCYEITDRNGEDDMLLGIEESVEFIKSLNEKNNGNNSHLIEAAIGGHAAFTLQDKSLALISDIVEKTGRGFHIHAAEDEYDVSYSHHMHSKDIIERLLEFNLLNEKSIIAHGVKLSNEDLDKINKFDSFLIHNPRSNMNNGVGYFNKFNQVNNIALGSDGIGSNMFEELKFAYFKNMDTKAGLQPYNMLRYLHNGNLILERYFNKKFGKIEKGYCADIVIYDYNPPTPLNGNNLAGHFIYGFSSRDVETVLINGKVVYEERQFPFEVESIYKETQKAAEVLWKRIDEIR